MYTAKMCDNAIVCTSYLGGTRTANSIGTFRSGLKTDLFAKAYVTKRICKL